MDIDLIEPIRQTTKKANKQKKRARTIIWEEKILHGKFVRQTKEVENRNRWQWFRNGTLKRETKSLICDAQEQAIGTNLIEGKIDKSQEQTKCRVVGLMRQLTILTGFAGIFIGKFVEQMESILN